MMFVGSMSAREGQSHNDKAGTPAFRTITA